MALMVSPISNVSFRAQEVAANTQGQSLEDILSRPGAYTKPENTVVNDTPKKHKFLKFVIGTIVTATIIALSLYGLKNGFKNIFDPKINLEGKQGFDKFKGFIQKTIGQGGEYVEKGINGTKKVFTKEGWDNILKSLNIKKETV